MATQDGPDDAGFSLPLQELAGWQNSSASGEIRRHDPFGPDSGGFHDVWTHTRRCTASNFRTFTPPNVEFDSVFPSLILNLTDTTACFASHFDHIGCSGTPCAILYSSHVSHPALTMS